MARALKGLSYMMGDDAMRVLAWALAQRTPPTVASIMEKWPVCRATAYRWLPRLAERREMVALYVERLREDEARAARRISSPELESRLQ